MYLYEILCMNLNPITKGKILLQFEQNEENSEKLKNGFFNRLGLNKMSLQLLKS